MPWVRVGSSGAALDVELFHRARSADALRKLDDVQLDWAYVDGGHDYETVLADSCCLRGAHQAGRHPRWRRHALDAVAVRARPRIRGEELARHIGRPLVGRRCRGELRAPVSPVVCARGLSQPVRLAERRCGALALFFCCARLCN